ncbi:hypothetical protein [Novosphingobium sp. SG707]|uniref:hypothetical protein n=1 Tax=Novosphingobium sp. SG707 TaxID=2586996 RepID=UPI0017E7FE1A|nr:hypothetical protein [Novosphingobium sp. SG707]NKJ01299.1 hypothetical protein [Novosphingobium sp. SG707]
MLKTIIRNHLNGAEGREKREGWVPRWMTFPPSAYTTRGGVGTVIKAELMAQALSNGELSDDEDRAETGMDDPVDHGVDHDGDADGKGAPLAA